MKDKNNSVESPDSLLSIGEASQFLRISKTGVYRLLRKRALGFYRIEKCIRIRKKDLESYLSERHVRRTVDYVC